MAPTARRSIPRTNRTAPHPVSSGTGRHEHQSATERGQRHGDVVGRRRVGTGRRVAGVGDRLGDRLLDLRLALSDLTHLLNRFVGEKVRLALHHDPAALHVRADRRQLEQVIMNLVVNARDAMPEGGEVRIETENVTLERPWVQDSAAVPVGPWVLVRVSDEGTGIPPDRLPKIFEPFYTTKKVGQGTGLGLSTVYGIVKQSGGYVFAESEVGRGTVFTLWLPASAGVPEPVAQPVAQPVAVPRRGGEVVQGLSGTGAREALGAQGEALAREVWAPLCRLADRPAATARGEGPVASGRVASVETVFSITGTVPGGTAECTYIPVSSGGGAVDYAAARSGVTRTRPPTTPGGSASNPWASRSRSRAAASPGAAARRAASGSVILTRRPARANTRANATPMLPAPTTATGPSPPPLMRRPRPPSCRRTRRAPGP